MFKQLFCLEKKSIVRSKSRTRRSHHHLFPGYRNEKTDGSYDSFLVYQKCIAFPLLSFLEEMQQYVYMNNKKKLKKDFFILRLSKIVW